MSDTTISQPNYLRKLSRNGRCRQIILPAALIRGSSFTDAEHVVISPNPDGTLTIWPLDKWLHHHQTQETPK